MEDLILSADQIVDFEPWRLFDEPRLLTGFGFGFSYPSVFLRFQLTAVSPEERARLSSTFEDLLNEAGDTKPLGPLIEQGELAGDDTQDLVSTARWFALLASRLNVRAGLPVIQPAKVVRLSPTVCCIAAPTLVRGLAPLANLLKIALAAFQASSDRPKLAELRPLAAGHMQQLRAANLTTSNTPRLVKAAVENGIAFQEVVGTNVIQYGLGRKSALLDSTFTHRTPNIGARLARNKHQAAVMLKRHRLPVPDHSLVSDEQQAIAAANSLGYPVVIKPADQDGGVAVQADLQSEQELTAAFSLARRASPNVLVERHVPGRDYRLTVFQGRCVWAVERQPAGVTGDGKSTVKQLVDMANTNPNRGSGPHSPLKLLNIDDEALGILSKQGVSGSSVLPAGQFVRLRRASNVSSGGMPIAVFDNMHPDNGRLAVRAARALKLDLAGVDLIIPDLAVSWKKSGAAICEVNGQPELGGTTAHHLYPRILKGILNGDGHIPTVAIIGDRQAEAISQKLADHLLSKNIIAGLHNRRGISIGGDLIEEGRIPQISAGRMLAGNESVEALIFGATNFGVTFHGFPIPRVDVLVLTGEPIERALLADETPPVVQAIQCLQTLRPNCGSLLMLDTGDEMDVSLSRALKSLGLKPDLIQPSGVVGEIARRLSQIGAL